MPKKTKRPIWLGALLAPLAAPVIYYVGVLIFSRAPIEGVKDILTGLLIVFVFAAPVSYLASLILGVPFVMLLKAKDRLSFWWCSLGGIPLGAVSFVLFLVAVSGMPILTEVRLWEIAWFIGAGGALGFGVASTFCTITGITIRSTGRSLRRAG